MKVAHFSTSVNFSSVNCRLQRGLISAGVDSNTYVNYVKEEIDNVYTVKRSKVYSIYYFITNKIEKLVMKKYKNRMQLPFSFGNIGMNITKKNIVNDVDIIHLHWINDYISIRGISQLSKLKKPIVWTMHDSWAFTGGCHVRYGCNSYEKAGCHNCHELAAGTPTKVSFDILKKKRKYWRNNNIVAVAPSKWMYESILRSKLFSDVRYIPNFVDTKTYSEKVYRSDDRIHILFGAVNATSVPYKGYTYLLDSLDYIFENYPQYANKFEIQIFGSESVEENDILVKFKRSSYGVLNSDIDLAMAYQGADIYVLPSLDDNLPSTVLESMSCGTPVVAFNVGGIPDMIDHQYNGYLANYKQSEDLAKGIIWVIDNNKDFSISRRARKKIESNFSEEIVIPQYIELYNSLSNR